MDIINIDTINKFNEITGYDIGDFFKKVKSFFQSDYTTIVSFYNGDLNILRKEHIQNLNYLTEQCLVITNHFQEKKKLMDTIDFWNLLESFSEIKTKLETTLNISKYLRSSIVSGASKSGFTFNYSKSSEQSLEDISKNILKENSFENSWVDIAFQNELKEIDYDVKENKKVELSKKIFQSNLVTSMIDNTIGERVYGKDIKKVLTIIDDDLEVLNYKETVEQTVDILSTLKKGDIPEFPDLGINSKFYKGTNFSQLNLPSLQRNLKANFNTDDLFLNFKIRNIKTEEGDLFIEFEIDTKYEMVLIKQISL